MKEWKPTIDEDDVRSARTRRSLRRADRYTAMALAGLSKCGDGALSGLSGPDTALITYSILGPHATVFATLDDILDYPEDLILPTKFSHSVVNAAASYIGTELGITGATFAFVGFEDVRGGSLSFARTMLACGMCRRALVVGVEEKGLLSETMAEMMPERFTERIRDRVEVFLLDGTDMESPAT